MGRVTVESLDRLIRSALSSRNVPDGHAEYVADGLVFASLRGIDSHGVRLLPRYLAELDGGRAQATPRFVRRQSALAVATLDAGSALGHVAGRMATDIAIELAGASGVGAVAVSGSNHFGAASYYTATMTTAGMVGIATTAAASRVAPFHGLAPFFGTNPLSIAAPSEGGAPFVLDMATSQICYSKLVARRECRRRLEPGWAITEDGDAARSVDEAAALSPLGGYKGQGLAMATAILSCLLTGSPLDHELSHFDEGPWDSPRGVGHFFIALDIRAFTDPAGFGERLGAWQSSTRAQPSWRDGQVQTPGDREHMAECERSRLGIPVSDADYEALSVTAAAEGIELELHRGDGT